MPRSSSATCACGGYRERPVTYRTIGVAALRALLVVLLVYGLLLGLHAISLTGNGWRASGAEWLFGLVLFVALLSMPIAVVCLASPRLRGRAANWVISLVALIVSSFSAARTANAIRMHGFALAAERAAPLVAAIERYERDHGMPPVIFSALVPRYILAIPDGLPPLELITGDRARQQYRGNEWVLVASVPQGFINFDQFMYFPNGDYPDHGYGGSIERVAGWAYVHE